MSARTSAVRFCSLCLGIVALGSCNDSMGPVPADLSGVWIYVGGFLDPADTLTLMIPPAPDSEAAASSRPLYRPGWWGFVHRSDGHLTGTLSAPMGGILELDLTLRGIQLIGTVHTTATTFSRDPPTTTRFAGTWVTSTVGGVSPDLHLLDTLVIERDGRIQRYHEIGIGDIVTCAMNGMPGAYQVNSEWLIARYAWPPGNLCAGAQLLDSLRIVGETLTRTTHLIPGDQVEVLTRQ